MWLVGGRLASDAMALVFYIALARAFGQGGIGDYSFAFAIAAFFGLGVEFGLPALLTREVARSPRRVHDYFGTLFALQVGLSLGLGGAVVWLCLASGYPGPLWASVASEIFVVGATMASGQTSHPRAEGSGRNRSRSSSRTIDSPSSASSGAPSGSTGARTVTRFPRFRRARARAKASSASPPTLGM